MHKQVANDDDNAASQPQPLPLPLLLLSASPAGSQMLREGPIITLIRMAIDLLGHINNMALIGCHAQRGLTD